VLQKIISKIIGDNNENSLKKIKALVPEVNEYFTKYDKAQLDQKAIQAKTAEFKERLQSGETREQILPEAFGLVKYAAKYLCGTSWEVRENQQEWNMIPYDVQIIGGICLHQGKIAEMKTGEGKTLVCTFPAYLNALMEKGVHVVTVNDYLARRDAEWMSGLYECLGLTVGSVYPNQSTEEKKEAYQADITYGTNNEFGFDYLRDNMANQHEEQVQRGLFYAIVDEVDSILIDEARTPLIISAPAEESTDKYYKYTKLVGQLKENEHYNVDEKLKTATLSEAGIAKMESLLGVSNIYEESGFEEVHHIEQALRAHAVYQDNTDYVVKDGQIMIVDAFTGRLMAGRRFGQGLHQAIEAKEGVDIQRESRTLATITFQNYFRLFDKLSGMTGTAKTEEEEFYKIYGLETIIIPTNKPIARKDLPDKIYPNIRAKYKAIAKTTKELQQKGQPVLIGTVSVEQSETLSSIFKASGIKHEVLNAKQHEKEAEIVTNAGQPRAVTIATNMAGRGTDIKITDEVRELGGLYIIGTERHESRRIDNQLRGRAGRQGDPGVSCFYVSLEDNVMRIFGGDRMQKMMSAVSMPEDMPITNRFITRAIESSQKRVEGYNFDLRKHVVEYDDVMNYHREIIYKLRHRILLGEDMHNEIFVLMEKQAEQIVLQHRTVDQTIDYKEVFETISAIHKNPIAPLTLEIIKKQTKENDLIELIKNYLWEEYKLLEKNLPSSANLREFERRVYLRNIDIIWMQHIDSMTSLRKTVSLEAYGQRDPLLVYKDIAYTEFQKALNTIGFNTVTTLFRVKPAAN
jgi:preprotein translocase subunit SecA